MRFFFLWLLRCFTSPGLLHTPMNSVCNDRVLRHNRVSPFGYSRVKGCLGPHRDFSHPAASFIVFWCLGIHRAPLFKLRTTKTLNCAFAVLCVALNYFVQGSTYPICIRHEKNSGGATIVELTNFELSKFLPESLSYHFEPSEKSLGKFFASIEIFCETILKKERTAFSSGPIK